MTRGRSTADEDIGLSGPRRYFDQASEPEQPPSSTENVSTRCGRPKKKKKE